MPTIQFPTAAGQTDLTRPAPGDTNLYNPLLNFFRDYFNVLHRGRFASGENMLLFQATIAPNTTTTIQKSTVLPNEPGLNFQPHWPKFAKAFITTYFERQTSPGHPIVYAWKRPPLSEFEIKVNIVSPNDNCTVLLQNKSLSVTKTIRGAIIFFDLTGRTPQAPTVI